jgi:hypothetical protein
MAASKIGENRLHQLGLLVGSYFSGHFNHREEIYREETRGKFTILLNYDNAEE